VGPAPRRRARGAAHRRRLRVRVQPHHVTGE
jgi:hypothetical protein